jgi:hypothetical protein
MVRKPSKTAPRAGRLNGSKCNSCELHGVGCGTVPERSLIEAVPCAIAPFDCELAANARGLSHQNKSDACGQDRLGFLFHLFEVLPRLKSGVLIHFHDIFHPPASNSLA